MSENNTLKQIACIAAYSAGVAVGIYGACKIVNAIEKKWPMKSNPLEAKLVSGKVKRRAAVKLDVVENGAKATLTVSYKDGLKEVVTFEGTPAEMNVKMKELDLTPFNPQAAAVPAAA